MENIISIFVRSIFIDNMVFAFFFGMCSYIAVSKSVKTAMGLSPGALGWIDPAYGSGGASEIDLSFLSFIVFIAVIASFVQLVEMVVEKFAPALYNQLGIFLPLIAVNCAIMGGSLFMQERDYASLGEATAFAAGSGIGWWLAIVLIAAIREKIAYSNVPAPLRGAGITFILTGLMGIAFMTFMGIQL